MTTVTSILRRRMIHVVVAAGIALVLVWALFLRGGGSADSRTVTAYFRDASPLVTGNAVKAKGVVVGSITDIKVVDGRAAVTMELNPSVLPLHEDASATVRAKSLLGERYVDLNAGTSGSPTMTMPGAIPVKQTAQAVDLQDLLNTLDHPTTAALSAAVTTLGEGTKGQGANVRKTLAELAPTLLDLNQLGRILDNQNALVSRVVDRLTPVAEALADDNGRSLDRGVASADSVLGQVALNRSALDTALVRLPQALRTFQTTVQQVTGLSADATGTLKGLRPVTSKLPAISRELRNFANAADPALASLPPVLRRAKALITNATPVVRALGPGVHSLRGDSVAARRLVGEIQPHLDILLDFVRGWALSTNGTDGLGNYFRGLVAYTPQDLLQAPGIPLGDDLNGAAPGNGSQTSGGSGPATDTSTSGPKGSTPGATGSAPNSGQVLDQLLGALGLDNSASAPSTASQRPGGSATGLTSSQEQDLVGMLLGGGN